MPRSAERAVVPSRARVEDHERIELSHDWEAGRQPAGPDTVPGPSLSWMPARVPGTAAGCLRAAGILALDDPPDLDAEDWWFRTSFPSPRPERDEQLLLRLDGIATVSEIYLNGSLVRSSDSMFTSHALDVGSHLRDTNELLIRCRGLAPLLSTSRKPRARWRTRLVADNNLRFHRTMLMGRAPGFAPAPAAVGPWRPVWLERRRRLAVEELELVPSVREGAGELRIAATVRLLDGNPVESACIECVGASSAESGRLAVQPLPAGEEVRVEGALRLADVERWWPHTHGTPVLYSVAVLLTSGGHTLRVDLGRVGFREISNGPGSSRDVERDSLDLHVNGVGVFMRGAVWTPPDLTGMAPGTDELRATLELAANAGMNVVRIPGTGAYESDAFYDLCDELGMLVWQDFMFANLDYPFEDPELARAVETEIEQTLDRLLARPSIAVLCGNSEMEQQAAMMGRDGRLARGELFARTIPERAAAHGLDAVYVPSAPCGGALPFRPAAGIASYFGVGGYMRPLTDVRLAQVRFAAECLAFSNVPDDPELEATSGSSRRLPRIGDPAWKRGIPRDVGADWDFEDVRDHYLAEQFGIDPVTLRERDEQRYLELSRIVTGEVIAEVIGEWRRADSPCLGAIVLCLRDLRAGAGWGLLDAWGEPKVAYHHLRRAAAPVAAWIVDEGLAGMRVHVANDSGEELRASLRVALYADLERKTYEVSQPLELPAHGAKATDIESMIGHFVDPGWAYRFGPPSADVIVASLEAERDGEVELLSQAVRLPVRRPVERESAASLGISAAVTALEPDGVEISLASTRFAYGVRMHVPGFKASDDSFHIEPGKTRKVLMRPAAPGAEWLTGAVTAVNLQDRVPIESSIITSRVTQ